MAPMLVLLAARASAFPGLLLHGTTPNPPTVKEADVVVVMSPSRTVLTVFHAVSDEPDRFGVLVPVPAATPLDGVHDVDGSAWNVLRDYTGAVAPYWSCAEGGYYDNTKFDPGVWGVPGTPEYADDAYSHELLTAVDAAGLLADLGTRGLNAPDGAEAALAPYVARGDAFLLVWRDTSAAGSYENAAFQVELPAGPPTLAFDLGSLSADPAYLDGWQQGSVVVLGPLADGRTVASGWTQATYDTECMVETGHEDSPLDYYDEMVSDALMDSAPAFTVDFAWEDGGCSPCKGDPPSGDELATFGWRDPEPYFTTRLTFGYSGPGAPAATLAATGDGTPFHALYISAREEAEETFPICGEGWVEDPGGCEDEPQDTGTSGDPPPEETGEGDTEAPPPEDTAASAQPKGCGCDATGAPGSAVTGLLVLLGLRARKRYA